MNSKCTYIGGEKHMKIIDGGVTSAKGFEAALSYLFIFLFNNFKKPFIFISISWH